MYDIAGDKMKNGKRCKPKKVVGGIPGVFKMPGTNYYVVKTDDHNFKLASTYSLATNSSPTVLTITGGTGGNASDSFDPGKNLLLSAGPTISASQFSFPTDTLNDTNATSFGMESTNIETSVSGVSVANPSAGATHFHFNLGRAEVYGVGFTTSSKTVNTTGISSSSTTITSSAHGFKTGDKILYTNAGTAMTGLTGGTSYYANVVDANTFSLASTYANASNETPTLISFGGGNGNSSDTFSTVVAKVYDNDFDGTNGTEVTSIGVTAEIRQVSNTNAQVVLIKESDKDTITIDTNYHSNGTNAETFGFKTNLTRVNVINDSIKLTSIATDYSDATSIDVTVPSNVVFHASVSDNSVTVLR